MAEGLTDLLFRAYRHGAACTLLQLREYEEFSGLGLIPSLQAISEKLAESDLCISPEISEGDLEEERLISRVLGEEGFIGALNQALEESESHNVEFKESLYVKKKVLGNNDVPQNRWVGEEIIMEVVATICSFLNSDGGTLVIGVSDDADLVGIDCELGFIPGNTKDLDNWELFLSNCLQKYIYDYKNVLSYIKRKVVERSKDCHVCVIIVRPRGSALSVCRKVNDHNAEAVFVRNGNGKAELKARAIEELIKSRMT